MVSPPTICLAIPAYNSANDVTKRVEEARKQTLPFTEIIVYSDGSQDDTVERCKALGINCLASSENLGSAIARQKILEHTKCSFIHFHDADDPFYSDEFCELLAPLCSPGESVFSSWKTQNPDKTFTEYSNSYYKGFESSPDFWIHKHVHLNAVIHHVDTLKQIGGFDLEMRQRQDLLLHVNLSYAGVIFKYVPQTLALHQKNARSTLGNSSENEKRYWAYKLCEKLCLINGIHKETLSEHILYHYLKCIDAADSGNTERFRSLIETFSIALKWPGKMTRSISYLFGLKASEKYYAFKRMLQIETR